jgi:redox-regulated HSP33 family molecular chaperone
MSIVLPTRNELAQVAQNNQRMIRWFEDATASVEGLGPLATLTPTGTADATTFLRGDGAWIDPFAFGRVRARVNFNGTGVIAIREAANVASITDVGAGVYGVNFTTAMANANYTVAVSVSGARMAVAVTNYATGSVQVEVRDQTGTLTDQTTVSVTVFQ